MLISIFIVSAITTFRTLYIQLLSTTCFGHSWPSSDRLYNNTDGKGDGGLMFTVNILKYIKFR